MSKLLCLTFKALFKMESAHFYQITLVYALCSNQFEWLAVLYASLKFLHPLCFCLKKPLGASPWGCSQCIFLSRKKSISSFALLYKHLIYTCSSIYNHSPVFSGGRQLYLAGWEAGPGTGPFVVWDNNMGELERPWAWTYEGAWALRANYRWVTDRNRIGNPRWSSWHSQ